MKVSVVIPIYNSEWLIHRNVALIIDELDGLGSEYELILCDDASEDNSREVLQRLKEKFGQVRIFSNIQNEGLGATLKKLFFQADGNLIIYSDIDLLFGVGIISRLVESIGNNDIMVASRYYKVENEIDFVRRMTSRAYYWLCRILLRIPVLDIGSGAVIFRREAIKKIRISSNGFGVHAEIFAKALRKRMKIKELPARIVNNEKGSFSILKHGWKILFETMRLWICLVIYGENN